MADIEDGATMATSQSGNSGETQAVPRPKKFTGRKKLKRRAPTKNVAVSAGAASQLPDEIKNNPELDAAISVLPSNYNFEVRKTIWKVKEAGAQRVALQFPEGLLMFACIISDIVRKFTGADTVIMGDVTYGACCVDDLSAKALGCDFMVHYGHSCLVPIDVTSIKMLYVFVEITFDTTHLVDMIKEHFDASRPLAVMGTIQFAAAIHKVRSELSDHFPSLLIPKCKPLSPGEVLGCTSPKLPDDIQEYVFVADGRFHLESAMIHNPTKQAFRYNPYDKTMTKEGYEHEEMRKARKDAIDTAAKAQTVGLILGTLGRQGNPAIMQRLKAKLKAAGKRVVTLLMSEIFPQKLALMPQVDAWVQVACPRLSVDWGTAFAKPLLNPYEAEVALATAEWAPVYPMDYYASGSGSWTNYHKPETGTAAEQSDAGVVIHTRAKAAQCGTAAGCACATGADSTASGEGGCCQTGEGGCCKSAPAEPVGQEPQ